MFRTAMVAIAFLSVSNLDCYSLFGPALHSLA